MNGSEEALRVSDADRERVVEELRAHAGDGRLDLDELEERTSAALAARTLAQLRAVKADLPARRTRVSPRASDDFRAHLRVFVAVQVLLVTIWALTGMGYFWPVWPFLGWGIGVLSHAGAFGTCSHSRRSPAKPV
jgi:fatty acid desaturase